MFQLSREEWISFTKYIQSTAIEENKSDSFSNDYNLRSQIVTSRFSDKWGGNRQQPYAFTEIGVTTGGDGGGHQAGERVTSPNPSCRRGIIFIKTLPPPPNI